MKHKMLNLIKSAIQDETKLQKLENIYSLYDQLQYSENINEMADSLVDWLHEKYKIISVDFSLFDLENETTSSLLKRGEEFYLDAEFSFYFIINTHSDLNAIVSFCVNDQEHYDALNEERDFIEMAFFQISPILQNGIIKKHYIEMSSIDSVTNVYNRKYLIEHIHKIMSLSHTKEETISFLMIGIDRFKSVIEEFDYDVGDKVLVALAQNIHKTIRDTDIVARLIGDEFVVALINLKSDDEVYEIANRIVDRFSQIEIIVDDKTKQILKKTVCIGISTYPKDSDDINQVLKNADNFLDEARNKGRGQIAIFNKEENSSIDLF